MTEKRGREEAEEDGPGVKSKTRRTAKGGGPHKAAETYAPPATEWLKDNRRFMPAITYRFALAVSESAREPQTGSGTTDGQHPFVTSIQRLLEYRNTSGFINVLYSFVLYPDNCVSYVNVIAKRTEWLFGYASRGRFDVGGRDGLTPVCLSFDGSDDDLKVTAEATTTELVYDVNYCAIVDCNYHEETKAVHNWIVRNKRRSERYAWFLKHASDTMDPDDARELYEDKYGYV